MIRVIMLNKSGTTVRTWDYDGNYSVKVLQSGALKIVKPTAVDIPEVGQDENGEVFTKEDTVAIFSGGTFFAAVIPDENPN